MNRVEIVNLGGRAYQIEAEGAAAIDGWLADAARSLKDDPDRDDLLLDFERAIGEKCDARVSDERHVVTTEQVFAILESLGTIEPVGVGELAFAGPQPLPERTRRLYRLPGERMIAGVCSGLAAWLGIDVTVVRVAAAALPVVTLGLTEGASIPLFIGLYVLLALVLPRADSPEALAAARGRGTTAQDVLLQARSGALPALSRLGRQLASIILAAMRVARVILLLAIVALLAAWIVGAGWLALAGDSVLNAFGSEVSRWLVPALFACAAVLAVVPLVAGVAVLDYATRPSEERRRHPGHLTAWLLASSAAWVTAVALGAVLVATVPGVRDVWTDGEGRIPFMDTVYCFYDGVDAAHCQPGDERVVIGGVDPDLSSSEAPSMPVKTPFSVEPRGAVAPAPRRAASASRGGEREFRLETD